MQQSRVWVGLGILVLTLLVTGYFWGDRQGLLLGLLFALALVGLSYYYSEGHWIDAFDATPIEGQDAWGVLVWVKDLSARAKVNVPRMYLVPHDFPTAFSIGRTPRQSRILITRGCLDKLKEPEIKAVLAHEISRIHRGDPLRFGVIAGLAAPLLLVTDGLDTLLWLLTLGRYKRALRHLLLPVFVLFFRIVFHKSDQYETDRFAAHLLRDSELLARVLMKLQSYSLRQPPDFPPTAAESMIVNPLTVQSSNRYFKSQPTVEDRIEKLVGRYPV